MGRGGVGTSRSEFLAGDLVDDLRYQRNGGCFVTTKRAIGFILFAIFSLITVIILMYLYGPDRRHSYGIIESNDIEELINKTINEETDDNIRLPTNFYPIHYRLKLHPILDEFSPKNFTYNGQVQILLKCNISTNKIILNVDNLHINKSDVIVSTRKTIHIINSNNINITNSKQINDYDNSNTEEMNFTEPNLIKTQIIIFQIEELYHDIENEKLVITLIDTMEVGNNYTVDIRFNGNITKSLVGFYRTSYLDLTGQKRWLATTYFHPIFARRVFPCFDEPLFKSTFEISIARRTNMTVLSNMPLHEEEPIDGSDGWVWDHFEKSLPMSTYLVSFTICDFKNKRNEPEGAGPIINIWAPEVDLIKASYALDVIQKILEFLENYLDIKYPLSKIDILAIPNFAIESMGSWGIISFQKSSLLVDDNVKLWEVKQKIFTSLSHELAHQWFGNLVTMKWWDDLWLNEGIGRFMAEVIQKNLRPHWQTSNNFPLRIMYKSFNLDSLKSTNALQKEITKNIEIEQISERIIQSKGTSLIRMLNYTLSETVFRKGLQHYLKELSYKSSDQITLWTYLNEIASNYSVLPKDVNVETFMNSWTKQKGYPYVTVTRDYDTGSALLTQKIFIQNDINNNSLWYIPLTYTSTDDVIKTAWMKNERNINLKIKSPGWILFNIDQAAYFRVNYDPDNWKLLIKQLNEDPNDIQIASRSQLLNDAFELGEMKIINYSIPMDLTKYLRLKESNYIPWFAALDSLEDIKIIIDNYEYTGIYDDYLNYLIKPKLKQLGLPTDIKETQNDKILRWRLLKVACRIELDFCVDWAKKQFEIWMSTEDPDNNNPIPFEYRSTVECAAIKTGGRREWYFLWNRTISSQMSSADLTITYKSLGCTRDPWIIKKYLELTINGNIPMEYVPYVWQSISHPVGIRTGFHFLRLNWDRIYQVYEDIYIVLSAICQDFLSNLSTEIDLQDLTQFFIINQNELRSVASLIQATVDVIKIRITWREKHLDSVIEWLKNDLKGR